MEVGALVDHEALLADGWRVRALVRVAEHAKATRLKDVGAELVRGDWDDASSLRAAVSGVYGVFSVQPFAVEAELEAEVFDRAYTQITSNGHAHWADTQRTRAGAIDHEHGGRGVYLLDPSGHYLELITRPYL